MVALAQQINENITSFTRKIAGQEIAPAGELRVTTNDSLLIHLLTPLFAGFRRQCRNVRLDVVLANQALNLSKRDADVAIRATDKPPENLVGRRVATIAWALYGCAAYAEPAVDLERPSEHDWVSLADNLATLKVVKFVQEHVPPERIVYKVNTVLGLAEAIEAGMGLGHLPCFIGDRRPGIVRLAPPDPNFAADLLASNSSRPASFAASPGIPRFRGHRDCQAAPIDRRSRLAQSAVMSSKLYAAAAGAPAEAKSLK
jgi:DNA-binding transcriptional LysR family regulator